MIAFIKKILAKASKRASKIVLPLTPAIIPRNQHCISRKTISSNALKVLYRLHDAGFEAYLVGGGVRDSLLGREPKDFDIATNANPDEVYRLFRNAITIGRRFRLVHVRFHGEIIEVATFRKGNFAENEDENRSEHGLILRDNQYGTLADDVMRRDFTINALYYNIADFSVVDYTGGMRDLELGLVRIIGEPVARFREDPVRILRAVRFAAKLGFRIDDATHAAIPQTAELLNHVSSARLFDESLKLIIGGYGEDTFLLLRHLNLLSYLFPLTENMLAEPTLYQDVDHFILTMLRNTDKRLADGKIVNPAFMLAVMLWHARLQRSAQLFRDEQMPYALAVEKASSDIIQQQLKHLAIPKRLTSMVREIWQLQFHLEKRRPHRAMALVYHARFRAAYDFLLLRSEIEPALKPIASWWHGFWEADDVARHELIKNLAAEAQKRKRAPKKRNGLNNRE